MFRRKKGFTHHFELHVERLGGLPQYDHHQLAVEWKRGGKRSGMTQARVCEDGECVFEEIFEFTGTLFRAKKSDGKFDKKILQFKILALAGNKKARQLSSLKIDLSDYVSPTLDNLSDGRGEVVHELEMPFKGGKKAILYVRICPHHDSEAQRATESCLTDPSVFTSTVVDDLSSEEDMALQTDDTEIVNEESDVASGRATSSSSGRPRFGRGTSGSSSERAQTSPRGIGRKSNGGGGGVVTFSASATAPPAPIASGSRRSGGDGPSSSSHTSPSAAPHSTSSTGSEKGTRSTTVGSISSERVRSSSTSSASAPQKATSPPPADPRLQGIRRVAMPGSPGSGRSAEETLEDMEFVEKHVYLHKMQLRDSLPVAYFSFLEEIRGRRVFAGSSKRVLRFMDRLLNSMASFLQVQQDNEFLQFYWLATFGHVLADMKDKFPDVFSVVSSKASGGGQASSSRGRTLIPSPQHGQFAYSILEEAQQQLVLHGAKPGSPQWTATHHFTKLLDTELRSENESTVLEVAFGQALQHHFFWLYASCVLNGYLRVDRLVQAEAFASQEFQSSLRRSNGRDSMDGMVNELDSMCRCMRRAGCSISLQESFFGQLVHFISCRVVNLVLCDERLACTLTAFKLKMSLSKLSEWLSHSQIKLFKNIEPMLRPLESCADILLLAKSSLLDPQTREDVCAGGITDPQLVYLILHFNPDEYEPVKDVREVGRLLLTELPKRGGGEASVWTWVQRPVGDPPKGFLLDASNVHFPG